ncbi:hypothetical protein G6F24_017720 [Rhizopus arrhizus]|nr:hypothetical protein G6F24_017720 [Rhizopus arrhizus]
MRNSAGGIQAMPAGPCLPSPSLATTAAGFGARLTPATYAPNALAPRSTPAIINPTFSCCFTCPSVLLWKRNGAPVRRRLGITNCLSR